MKLSTYITKKQLLGLSLISDAGSLFYVLTSGPYPAIEDALDAYLLVLTVIDQLHGTSNFLPDIITEYILRLT